MLYSEIVRTSTCDKVIETALLCIGKEFKKRMEMLAQAHGMSLGRYAGSLVHRFADEAHEEELLGLEKAMRNSDLPLLCGLRYILERMVDGSDSDREDLMHAPWRPLGVDGCMRGARDAEEADVRNDASVAA